MSFWTFVTLGLNPTSAELGSARKEMSKWVEYITSTARAMANLAAKTDARTLESKILGGRKRELCCGGHDSDTTPTSIATCHFARTMRQPLYKSLRCKRGRL